MIFLLSKKNMKESICNTPLCLYVQIPEAEKIGPEHASTHGTAVNYELNVFFGLCFLLGVI